VEPPPAGSILIYHWWRGQQELSGLLVMPPLLDARGSVKAWLRLVQAFVTVPHVSTRPPRGSSLKHLRGFAD
jgi:hypothetical protein